MAERRLVFEGDSGIGFVQIYEGDILEFSGHPFTETEGPCRAFFSEEHTFPTGSQISFRLDNWGGCAREYSIHDCHSLDCHRLLRVVRLTKKLSGFGKFSKRVKENLGA